MFVYVARLPGKKQLLVFSLMLLVTFFAVLTTSPRVMQVVGNQRRLPVYTVNTDEKVLALTFDISWGTETPGPVLDILRDHGVQSTFFLSGPWALKNPSIPQRIKREGHEIASHGWQHINMSGLSEEGIREQLLKAHEALLEVTGVEANLIRTPNGDYNTRVIETIEAQGYTVIQWGTDSLDWMNPGVEEIVDRVLKRAKPGDIILMHASDTCKQTAEALPRILEGLAQKGFKFVTVGELLKMDKSGRWAPDPSTTSPNPRLL